VIRALFLALALFGGGLIGLAAGKADSASLNDSGDLTVWPNRGSRANSDRWLVTHHDKLRLMKPRVLVLNFSNEASRDKLDHLVLGIIEAIAEGSRYHGYANPAAPAFLQYQLFKFVDLRDEGATRGNSAKVPFKTTAQTPKPMDYGSYFSERFAQYYGVRNPRDATRFLTLAELVDGGYIHELWLCAEHVEGFTAYECVEEKPVYDERFRRLGNHFVQAGNGGDEDQPWTGRSLRIGFINASRGIGCFLESLSHSIEGTAGSQAIPYFTRYFNEFAGFDLDRRYELPWSSFYPLWGEDKDISYPDPATAVIHFETNTYRIHSYVALGGNVHFPPNARRHYDLENRAPVMSTIEDWRIGSGKNGADLARPWNNSAFARYRDMAPDCMGPWLIYWRQNFPGLDNRQKDAAGKRMKNWWPFLFY